MVTRREFLAASTSMVTVGPRQGPGGDSELPVRPRKPGERLGPGTHRLHIGTSRDGVLVVPRLADPAAPAPLALLCHGAGGRARDLATLFAVATAAGVIVLAPDSRGQTWDAIRGTFGPDVEFVRRALDHTFGRCHVDPAHIAVGGFSDGATYGLALGLDNGDLFTHVLAFSPGFLAARRPQGRPRVFISHGQGDTVLAIDATSRRIVPRLKQAGYDVKYREFDGPHTVPHQIALDAFGWFSR